MPHQKICVLGLGYIGLPTASVLATKGYDVLGVDVKPEVVDLINQGRIHIVEPELDILVRSAVHSGNLRAATEPAPADVFVIAVPTPFGAGHVPDLRFVRGAVRSIAPHVRPGDLVILESTSPVGTTDEVAATLHALRPDLQPGQVFVAHCPERVLPGRILRELIDNDRVVGGVDPASTAAAVAFYRTFVAGEVLATDARTAEMCKLVENSFRDVNIAFANELSMIAHEQGIDVWELIRLANRHPRVSILSPGPGVGGHCLAVDPWFVVAGSPALSRLIRTGREVNDAKIEWVVEQVRARAARFARPVVACLGLAYKPDIDDTRESPAVAITRRLRELVDGEVLASDPHVPPGAFAEFPVIPHQEAIARADVVVGLVAHRLYREIDPALLAGRELVDTCGMFR